MSTRLRFRAGPKRGAAALAVSMVLLFGMTLVAFFASRGMLFEQRTSVNQYRSTRAFEMAEAGLEWAVSRLNDNQLMAAGSCAAAAGGQSFADRYLPVSAGGFAVTAHRPTCSIAGNGAVTCDCPDATAPTATIGAATDPRFSVEYRTWPADVWTVEVVSFGCTNEGGAPCGDLTANPPPDGVAVVRALYKMRPTLPNAPGAGLVTGSYAITGGNLTVVNMDPQSNGITINSGTTVDLGTATTAVTLPGTPARASVLDNDPSLAALTNADVTGDIFFASFFGEKMAEFRNNPKTWLITDGSCGGNLRCTQCANEGACGTAISAAIDNGENRFWSDTDVKWTNNLPTVGTLGTADKPIVVAGDAALKLSSNLTAYGMFYSATATVTEEWTFTGSGTAKVFGAFVSRGSFDKGAGTLDLIYDPNIFSPQNMRGLMVRVPGSWRDKSSEF
jgi:Tfp pilus assembly protein PilX